MTKPSVPHQFQYMTAVSGKCDRCFGPCGGCCAYCLRPMCLTCMNAETCETRFQKVTS